MEQARNAAAEIIYCWRLCCEWTDSAAHCFGVVEKISVEFTESSSNQSIDPRGKIPVGYCLVSMESLEEFARRIQSNSPCSSDEMIIFSQFP